MKQECVAPAPAIQVNKEAVRVLAIQHGQREAARLAGLNENTVRSWAMRYNWDTQEQAQPIRNRNPVAERLTDVLQARKQQSRSLLSEYQVKALHEATAHAQPLSITRQVNDLASIHAKVWPEEQTAANQFSLNVLNLTMFDSTDA